MLLCVPLCVRCVTFKPLTKPKTRCSEMSPVATTNAGGTDAFFFRRHALPARQLWSKHTKKDFRSRRIGDRWQQPLNQLHSMKQADQGAKKQFKARSALDAAIHPLPQKAGKRKHKLVSFFFLTTGHQSCLGSGETAIYHLSQENKRDSLTGFVRIPCVKQAQTPTATAESGRGSGTRPPPQHDQAKQKLT